MMLDGEPHPTVKLATSLCCFEGDEVVNELGYGAARVLAAPPALRAQSTSMTQALQLFTSR
jgi:hypothetical protein